MTYSSDQFDKSKTLPSPELNPLQNPILGAHMGRWAEVYFTAAPEKREEAVTALLRELETGNATHPEAANPKGNFDAPAAAEPSLHCQECGYENPPGKKFCGMCGTALTQEFSERAKSFANVPASFSPQRPTDTREQGSNANTDRSFRLAHRDSGDESLHNLFETAPSSSARGIWIALAFIVLAAVLVYMGWRDGLLSSSLPSTPAAAASAAEQTDDSAEKPNTVTKPESGPSTEAAAERQPIAAIEPAEPPTARPSRSAPAESQKRIPVSDSGTVQQGGATELATAQDYLNGTNGRPRDPAAAATWLWQAVSKQNTEATLLLSDLYLKGTGVAKNCDQARVLLDAAAIKGKKDASYRLQHLSAFGCQ